MKKLVCFDVDGTITQKRVKIEPQNTRVLTMLSVKYKVLIVSSGGCKRIYEQLGRFPVEILGNLGLQHSVVENGEFRIIEENGYAVDKTVFSEKIDYLRKKYGYENYKGQSVEFHPTGMVSVPLLGTEADVKARLAFDPDRKKRESIYQEVKRMFPEYDVYVGGSNSFDFSDKRFNKFTAIKNYAEKNGYALKDIVYFGDEYMEGGGDYPVFASEIDAVKITDYTELPQKTAFLLK